MTVTDAEVIDAIGIESSSGHVVLTITDHLDWTDDGHIPALQAKLNSHLAFIESGEILETYPDAKGHGVRIDIVCKYHPDGPGLTFLKNAREAFKSAGLLLTWRELPRVQ